MWTLRDGYLARLVPTVDSRSFASLVSVEESNSKKTLTLRSASIARSNSAWPCAMLVSDAGVELGASATAAGFSSALFACVSGLGCAPEQAARPAASEIENR